MLKRRVDVQVRVSIDQSGRVVKAEPVVSQGGINQYLGTNAANTARLWTFQPARRGDTPVMSELILNFTFGPANKQE
jgi:outer membrane biosynthesis protein TonB